MNIRVAKQKDIKAIAKLLYFLFSQEEEFSFNKKSQQKALKKIISNKKIGTIFVVTSNKKVIGSVNILYTYSTALNCKVAILEDMIVSPKYRGKNIGSKLLKYTLKYLKNKKIKRVTLLTDKENIKAHKFYKKLEFKSSNMIVFINLL